MYVDDASKLPPYSASPTDLAVAARFVLAANNDPDEFKSSLTPELRNTPMAQLLLLVFDANSGCRLHMSLALDICCWTIGCAESTHQCSPDDLTWQATVERARRIVAGEAA